ncbi:heme-binding protein 2-like [Pelobates fuscus]|uniref:heme-binding protein 2-like n=1 Tax=Pelobates fuscus TaxID=191477 RepID=UPI002FE4F31D
MCTELILVLTFLCVWSNEVTAKDGSDGYKTPDFCKGFKCPRYRVVEKYEKFEVREYEPTNWATTIVDLSADVVPQSDRLYRYIRGANKKGSRMNMTLPYSLYLPTSENTDTLPLALFYLPPEFETPKPLDDSIYVYSYPATRWYVRSFKGHLKVEHYFNHARVLTTELAQLKKPFECTFCSCSIYNGLYELDDCHNEVAFMLKDI